MNDRQARFIILRHLRDARRRHGFSVIYTPLAELAALSDAAAYHLSVLSELEMVKRNGMSFYIAAAGIIALENEEENLPA